MRTGSTPLLPIFRSAGQGRLLARVYLARDRPAPLREVARELGLSAGGLTREADRLEEAGLIRSVRIGRQRILEADEESPYYPELVVLLLKAFGPASLIGPALADIPGIDRAFIFGSWAARYLGQEGPQPADVDVLVVGAPTRSAVARAARDLGEELQREIDVTIVSADRFDNDSDGFIRQVKSGPLIAVDLDREPDG